MRKIVDSFYKFYGNYFYLFFALGFIFNCILDIVMSFEMNLLIRIFLSLNFGYFIFIMIPVFINEFLLRWLYVDDE